MSLHWFRPSRPSSDDLATYLEHLRPFGVRMRKDLNAWVSYQVRDGELVMEIGDIVVHPSSGFISIWPYCDAGPRERLMLAQCAEEAFEHPPTKANGWRLKGAGAKRWWSGCIVIAAREDDGGVVHLIARNANRMRAETAIALKAAVEGAPSLDEVTR